MNNKKISVAIFISGGGSFAKYAKESPILRDIHIDIIADRRDVKYPQTVSKWLIKKGNPNYWLEFEKITTEYDLIFLSFMWIVPSEIVKKFKGKIINHHLALLPHFRGRFAQQETLTSGIKISGSTFHFIGEEVDTGPIIAQSFFEVTPDDNLESFGKKNWLTSKDLYIQVIKWFVDERIETLNNGHSTFIKGAKYDFGKHIPNLEF